MTAGGGRGRGEHPPDDRAHGLLARLGVGEAVAQRVQLAVGEDRPGPADRPLVPHGIDKHCRRLVDQDQALEARGAEQLEVGPDHRAAHRMPDQHRIREREALEQLREVVGQAVNRPAARGIVGATVTPLVVGHRAALAGQHLRRRAPLLGRALPAVDEHHRSAGATLGVTEADVIVGVNEPVHVVSNVEAVTPQLLRWAGAARTAART